MSDREIMMALYSAIDSLYFAVTGQPLRVILDTEGGAVKIQSVGGTSDGRIASGTAAQAV